jgi:hypothetical protein
LAIRSYNLNVEDFTLEELSLSNFIFVWLANMNDSLVRCNTSCEKCALLQNSKKSKLIHLKSQSWYQKHERNFRPKKLNINQTNFALDQKTFCGILKSNFFDMIGREGLDSFFRFRNMCWNQWQACFIAPRIKRLYLGVRKDLKELEWITT